MDHENRPNRPNYQKLKRRIGIGSKYTISNLLFCWSNLVVLDLPKGNFHAQFTHNHFRYEFSNFFSNYSTPNQTIMYNQCYFVVYSTKFQITLIICRSGTQIQLWNRNYSYEHDYMNHMNRIFHIRT